MNFIEKTCVISIFLIISAICLIPIQYIEQKFLMIVSVVLLLLTIFTLVNTKFNQILEFKFLVFLVILMNLWLISSFSSKNLMLSLSRFVYYSSSGITVFIIVSNNFKKERLFRIFNHLLIGLSLIVSAYGLIEFFGRKNIFFNEFFNFKNYLYYKLLGISLDYESSRRILSTLGHPVTLGFFLVPGILLTVSNLLKRKNIINIFIFIIILLGLFLTYSRGSWLAVLIPCLIFLFRKRSDFVFVFLVTIVLLGGLIFTSGDIRQALIKRSPREYINNPVEMNRIGSYLTVSKIIKDYPLLGIGTANFRIVRYDYDEFETHIEGPDNLYLMILAEYGILGFGAFLLFLLFVYKEINKKLMKTKSQSVKENLEIYKIIFTAFLINFFFFDTLYHPVPRIIFWAITGVIAALCFNKLDK